MGAGRKRKHASTNKDSGHSLIESNGWKPVDVNLDERPFEEAEGGDDNHYDNPKLAKKASKELPVKPGEEVAMFYGLEVLDYSQYKLLRKDSGAEELVVKEENANASSSTSTSTQPKGGADGASTHDPALRDAPPPNKTSDEVPPEPKKKKGKKKNKEETTKKLLDSKSEALEEVTPDQVLSLQQSWSQASGGAVLDDRLCESLARQGFMSPTPIQGATLAAAMMGRRNLVGAAPTGSGKTLAFLLPILQLLFDEDRDQQGRTSTGEPNSPRTSPVALIIAPTRELAMQINAECDKLVPGKCVSLVGGIALVKQKRLLATKRPPILVGTPGRLWAMIDSGEHEHLNDLSKLQFLVLDEADRMTQEHSFPQLVHILNAVNEANPSTDDISVESSEDTTEEDDDRLLGLPGVRGEASLTMLTDDILQQLEAQREATDPHSKEVADDDYVSQESEDDPDDESVLFPEQPSAVHRQTFIYSATLTLPYTTANSKKRVKAKHRLEGGIAEILEKTRAMGETKVVDMSSAATKNPRANVAFSQAVRLPPGLRLAHIKCTQRHKDSHLYAYLMSSNEGSSGPCLVFCNSIAAVRRVGMTLQTLGLSVRILHAHMQQRARLKAVDSIKDPIGRSVVVCTDVAARGLDIPSVTTVVHYDVARSVDTFVHRSGRTARGIGEGAVGASLSLISPSEDKAHSKIAEGIQVGFSHPALDGRLLKSAQERVNLATKIVLAAELEKRTKSSNDWFLEQAEKTDMELDDDLLEDDSTRPEKELAQLREAHQAKSRLAQLLAKPISTQRFGKFLSTNRSAMEKIKQRRAERIS